MTHNIAIATISLDNVAGGLEKNVVSLANYFSGCGHNVTLITFDLPGATAFYRLDTNVSWACAGRTPPHGPIGKAQRAELIARIRQTFEEHRTTHLICFTHGILMRFLLAARGKNIKTICTERNALHMYGFVRANKWNANFLLLAFTHRIAVLFESYRQDYPVWLRRKIRIVHNPVFPATARSRLDQKNILSIGRLAPQKRFSLLLDAIAQLPAEFSDWRLTIIGEGPLESDLRQQITDLRLEDRVLIRPPVQQIAHYYQSATIYAQPSMWEGFPNALAEAMAAGVIPIGFAETRGVADMIEDGHNGVLTSGPVTAENFSRSLMSLLAHPEKWESLSDAARQLSQTYSVEAWQQKWTDMLHE